MLRSPHARDDRCWCARHCLPARRAHEYQRRGCRNVVVLEKALRRDPTLIGTFSPSGDSMIYVDKMGKRVTNEKLAYNESAQAFFKWDPVKSEYPNLVLMAIWDQRSQDSSASDEYGRFIVPKGVDASHVIKGKTWEELVANITKRVKKYSRPRASAASCRPLPPSTARRCAPGWRAAPPSRKPASRWSSTR